MAEGGEFGIDLPDVDKDIDHVSDVDEQEVNNTDDTFDPQLASTPGRGENIEMQNIQKEKGRLQPETSFDEIPSLEGFIHDEDKPKRLEKARDFIKSKFPRVDLGKLGPIGFSKRPGNDTTIVSFGTRGGETEIFRKDGKGLLQKFKDKFKTSLGPEAESLIAQDNDEIRENRQRLREAEKELRDAEKLASEREKATQEEQDLRIRIERTQAKIDQLGSNVEKESELREQQQRIKNYQKDFENAKKEVAALEKQAKTKAKKQTRVNELRASLAAKERERNTMEARLNDTRTLDELKEQEAELQRQNEEDQAVIDNEDASPSDKQAAEGRVAERQEELARLRTQIDERERALPLRERVKEIFKKYGVTVTAIVLAAGVTIGAVIGAITNALRATGKALGKGLKDIGSKVASALPGLIGSIVSFLFKAAGQAIGFLAEHTWLIILAVVAFLVEKYIKKQR